MAHSVQPIINRLKCQYEQNRESYREVVILQDKLKELDSAIINEDNCPTCQQPIYSQQKELLNEAKNDCIADYPIWRTHKLVKLQSLK